MKYPKLRELREVVKALIKGPYTTKFPKVESIPPDKFRGRPKFFEEDCVGCTACAEVCPASAIEVTDDDYSDDKDSIGKRKLEVRYHDCIFCGLCQASCITEKGIMQIKEYDLACYDRHEVTDSVDKELVYCQTCHSSITTKDHLLWVSDKVSTASYSNPTLYLSLLRSLGLTAEEVVKISEQIDRSDRIKILCAYCRRNTTLEK